MTRSVRIHPSILNADHSKILSEIDRVSKVSDLLHLDILDGKFAPNTSFTWEEAQYIISGSSIPVDAHLMVIDCDYQGPRYAEAGCESVTVHVEGTKNLRSTIRNIKSHGSCASLALKPDTSIEDFIDYVDEVDMFLIMTVEPGFGGQAFMPEMMDKVSRARQLIGERHIRLQVDGGISRDTIEIASAAGADTFVAGSAVYKAQDPAAMICMLRDLAQSVQK
ncbi:MAG: ribulose-phosphate 3-epimerase [Candidatus Planktophila sp.]